MKTGEFKYLSGLEDLANVVDGDCLHVLEVVFNQVLGRKEKFSA